MAKPVPFIDRDQELDRVDEFVREWGTRRIVCIKADGGVGKTRLLEEIRERCLRSVADYEKTGIRTDIKIATVLEFLEHEWFRRYVDGSQAMADELGVELLIGDGNFDMDRMAAELDRLIAEEPDCIIVQHGAHKELRRGMCKAIEQGIKVLTFDNDLKDVGGVTTRVAQDDVQGARLSLAQLAQDINYKGKIAMMWDDTHTPLKRRTGYLREFLPRYPDLELIELKVVIGANIVQEMHDLTKTLLRDQPDIKAIWAPYDEYARGVVSALIEEDRTDIFLYSFDLCPSDVEWMRRPDSPWKATAASDSYEAGRTMVRLAMLAAQGQPVSPHYFLPMKLITQDQVREQDGRLQDLWDRSDVGWTPWIRWLQTGYALVVSDIFDFDDRSLHHPQGLGQRVARSLEAALGQDGDAFAAYRRELRDRRQMEMDGESPETLRRQAERIDETFVECFNAVSARQRVVLFRDTTDALSSPEQWRYELLAQYENCVILIAGRNADEFGKRLKDLGQEVEVVDLQPLTDRDSRRYFMQKQEMLRLHVKPALADKILLLAAGRPILLDLAAERLAREVPFEWLTGLQIEDLKRDLARWQEDFERQLVIHYANTRQPFYWLILTMAHVNPLDAELTAELLAFPGQVAEFRSEARSLIEQARDFVFVKDLPGGAVKLHDEMERLIDDLVWPEVDPDFDRRRRDSQVTAAYLGRRVGELRQSLDQKKQDALRRADVQTSLEDFSEQHVLEQELWVLQQRRLEHLLFAEDFGQAVEVFAELERGATRSGPYSFREELINRMQPYTGRFTPTQLIAFNSILVKYYLDGGEYERANELARQLLASPDLADEDRIDTYIQQANIEVRRGRYRDGIDLFKDAVRLSRSLEWKDWLNRALNGLGWGYRLINDYERALDCYDEALELSVELGDKKREAWLLNNIAWIYTYQGDYHIAEEYCAEAHVLWNEIGEEKGLGALYIVYREIHRRSGRYDLALRYNRNAEEIFARRQDKEWLSQVYGGDGAILVLKEEPEAGEQALEKALEICSAKDRGWLTHWLGRALLEQDKVEEAKEQFAEGYHFTKELPDFRYQLYCLWGLVLVALRTNDRGSLDWLTAQYEEFRSRPEGSHFPAAEGLLLKSLGDLVLLDPPPGAVEQAVGYYERALPLIAQHISYGEFKLRSQIGDIEQRLANVGASTATIRPLRDCLDDMWRDPDLRKRHPGARLAALSWKARGTDGR
jgi:simple sugar transport system substrate-binding protein